MSLPSLLRLSTVQPTLPSEHRACPWSRMSFSKLQSRKVQPISPFNNNTTMSTYLGKLPSHCPEINIIKSITPNVSFYQSQTDNNFICLYLFRSRHRDTTPSQCMTTGSNIPTEAARHMEPFPGTEPPFGFVTDILIMFYMLYTHD